MIRVIISGDNPKAPCAGSDPYRTAPHKWRDIGGMVDECANGCGAMRGWETEDTLRIVSPETRARTTILWRE